MREYKGFIRNGLKHLELSLIARPDRHHERAFLSGTIHGMPERSEASDRSQSDISHQDPFSAKPTETDTSQADEQDSFEFVYDGPEVERGSMNVRELAEVLNGITRTFTVVAHDNDLGDQYELRVRDIETGSFHILFEAVAYVKANPVTSSALAASTTATWPILKDTATGVYRVITDIAKAISTKVALKGKPLATTQTLFENGEVRLTLLDETITLTKEQYELLLSRRLDKSLAQVVSPLSATRIESFEVRRADLQLAHVSANQRDFFDYQEAVEDSIKERTEIIGTLNSLTKTSRRGTFHTIDGAHVPYKYTGGDDAVLLRGFSSKEPVRVTGRISYDKQGVPTSIEAENIQPLQRRLE